jgi:hypothetical protein
VATMGRRGGRGKNKGAAEGLQAAPSVAAAAAAATPVPATGPRTEDTQHGPSMRPSSMGREGAPPRKGNIGGGNKAAEEAAPVVTEGIQSKHAKGEAKAPVNIVESAPVAAVVGTHTLMSMPLMSRGATRATATTGGSQASTQLHAARRYHTSVSKPPAIEQCKP